ncbi:MAG TPA: hypothetical protein VEJ18_04140 [Planctomycetota bacterium]|nr:hypothetical protein [Planctomycetota bacterium]
MGRPLEIPFSYGDILAITGSGAKVVMWFKDDNSVIRGVLVDVSDPQNPVVAKDEVVIRRKTEGQVRKRKIPPVGNPLP